MHVCFMTVYAKELCSRFQQIFEFVVKIILMILQVRVCLQIRHNIFTLATTYNVSTFYE